MIRNDKPPIESHVNLPRFNLKYLLKDYGDYRTISKLVYVDGKIDVTAKVDEYIYWKNPLKMPMSEV
jgi:hypothetical protein